MEDFVAEVGVLDAVEGHEKRVVLVGVCLGSFNDFLAPASAVEELLIVSLDRSLRLHCFVLNHTESLALQHSPVEVSSQFLNVHQMTQHSVF